LDKINIGKQKKRKPIPDRDDYYDQPDVDKYNPLQIHSPQIPKNQSCLLIGSMKFAQSVKAVKLFFKDKHGNPPLAILKAIDESIR